MKKGIPFEVSIPKNEDNLYNYFTDDELENTAKELLYIKEHPEEYKSYDNIDELKKDLLSGD